MSHQHLEGLNQPRSRSRSRSARGAIVDGLLEEDDESNESSLEASEIFEPPKQPQLSIKKPLLAATLKAMEDSKSNLHLLNNTSSNAHLEGINQPKPRSARSRSRKDGSGLGVEDSNSDEESLEASELFDPPKEIITKKPLLAATLKAMDESRSSKLNASTSILQTATTTATATPTTTLATTVIATAATVSQQQRQEQVAKQANKSSSNMNYNYKPKQKSSESNETENERKKKEQREQKDQKVCEEYDLKTGTTMNSSDTPLVTRRKSMLDSPAAAKTAATTMYTTTAEKMKKKTKRKNKVDSIIKNIRYLPPVQKKVHVKMEILLTLIVVLMTMIINIKITVIRAD